MDKNMLIGKENRLPWHLPADMKHFRETTMGKPVIMGRKTRESIGNALLNRKNIVLTRRDDYVLEDAFIARSIQGALGEARCGDNEVFVAGGEQVFAETLPLADRLYLTHIDHEFEGDTHFPKVRWADWRIMEAKEGIVDEENHYPHRFVVYDRVKTA